MEASQQYRNEVTSNMINILKARSLDTPMNLALVSDYGRLFDIKQELIKDINLRGVSVPYREMENGEVLKKKNDCIPELNKVIGQMSKITYDLGIRACDMDIKDAPIDL